MLKDVNMSSEELGFVINKIICMLSEVDLQELPPVIYQLLLLSTKVVTVLHVMLVIML